MSCKGKVIEYFTMGPDNIYYSKQVDDSAGNTDFVLPRFNTVMEVIFSCFSDHNCG